MKTFTMNEMKETLPDFFHCPLSQSAGGSIQVFTKITLMPVVRSNEKVDDVFVLEYIKENPMVLQIGDLMFISNNKSQR